MLYGAEAATSTRVPITLLTGFLGAGKTARLNATLATPGGQIAVIENEIGALGVDGALVANRHEESFDGVIELANGCLCCSGAVDLVAALEALVQRHRKRPLSRIIIETTGLADVGPVVAFLTDPDEPLLTDLVLDAVVAVVDVTSFQRWSKTPPGRDVPATSWTSGFGGTADSAAASADGPSWGLGREAAMQVFWRQVALSDQIILSKGDLAGASATEEVKDALGAANPVAELLVDPGEARPLPGPIRRGAAGGLGLPQGAAPKLLSASRTKVSHLAGVMALSFEMPHDRPIWKDPLLRLVGELLQGGAGWEAWRVKGLLLVEGEGPSLLQAVGGQISLESWLQPLKDPPFLVVIGEKLDRVYIQAALDACMAPAQARLGPG